nr:cyclophilin-like fold protein [Mesobacterium pallidum]
MIDQVPAPPPSDRRHAHDPIHARRAAADPPDCHGAETVADLGRRLDTTGMPGGCQPKASAITQYGPQSELAIFLKPFAASRGLVRPGQFDGPFDALAVSGDIEVRIDRADQGQTGRGDMPDSRIRMRHLRCFRAIARHGSVTRAAEDLGTVQPSVSRSLRELEDLLGAVLFDRTHGGLVLTEAGQTFLSFVSNGMGQIDRGVEALRGQMAGDRVVAYVLPNVARMIMPGAVRRFKTLYPEIVVTFLAAQSSGLQQYLGRGEVDFAFGRLLAAEHMSGLHFEHLYSESLQFFVRPKHPLVGRADLTVHDLDAFPVVLPIRGTIIRDEIDRFLVGRGVNQFSNLVETISFEFARNYLQQSDAVVCHPQGAMRRELEAGQVVPLDLTEDAMMGAVGVTTPAGHPPSAPAQLLIEMIRQEVREQGLS